MTEALQGSEALRRRLTAVGKVGPSGMLQKRWQLITIREAKIRVRRKTGNTGRSIQVRGTDAVVVGGAGLWLEFGTRPHDIVPRVRKALRFAASPAGARLTGTPRRGAPVVFARRVHHPGTRAYPFLRPAAEEALRETSIDASIIVEAWNGAA